MPLRVLARSFPLAVFFAGDRNRVALKFRIGCWWLQRIVATTISAKAEATPVAMPISKADLFGRNSSILCVTGAVRWSAENWDLLKGRLEHRCDYCWFGSSLLLC